MIYRTAQIYQPTEKIMSNFNFNPEKDTPTHRVEYLTRSGASVSIPAKFDNDKEAVRAALKEFIMEWRGIGAELLVVLKYGEESRMETVCRFCA